MKKLCSNQNVYCIDTIPSSPPIILIWFIHYLTGIRYQYQPVLTTQKCTDINFRQNWQCMNVSCVDSRELQLLESTRLNCRFQATIGKELVSPEFSKGLFWRVNDEAGLPDFFTTAQTIAFCSYSATLAQGTDAILAQRTVKPQGDLCM